MVDDEERNDEAQERRAVNSLGSEDDDDDDGDDDDDDDDHVGDVKDYDDSKRSPVAACKHRPVSLLASSVPNLICEECGIVLVILIIFLLGLSLSFIIAL